MKKKQKKIKVIKEYKGPGAVRILLGSAAAYWLSGVINPAFVVIAVMILLFFPVFFLDFLFPEPPPAPKPPPIEENEEEIEQNEEIDEASA